MKVRGARWTLRSKMNSHYSYINCSLLWAQGQYYRVLSRFYLLGVNVWLLVSCCPPPLDGTYLCIWLQLLQCPHGNCGSLFHCGYTLWFSPQILYSEHHPGEWWTIGRLQNSAVDTMLWQRFFKGPVIFSALTCTTQEKLTSIEIQLPTHDLSISGVPPVVTHWAPKPFKTYFHSSVSWCLAVYQPNISLITPTLSCEIEGDVMKWKVGVSVKLRLRRLAV